MIISTMNLAESIRTLREKTGLSQSELATEAGVNMHTISRIERGLASPTIRILEKIITAIVTSNEYRDVKAEQAEHGRDATVLLSFDNHI